MARREIVALHASTALADRRGHDHCARHPRKDLLTLMSPP
jgi:hypothetical protein